MKNTAVSANTVFAQVKKEGKKKEVKEAKEEDDDEEDDDDEEEEEEEENTEHKNEMYFYLIEAPSYQIWAEGRWTDNAAGEVIGDVDTYFHHILTGRRCESVRECFQGWTEPDRGI